jgi:hypothetical protein
MAVKLRQITIDIDDLTSANVDDLLKAAKKGNRIVIDITSQLCRLNAGYTAINRAKRGATTR